MSLGRSPLNRKKILLVDSHGLTYRAFFALPPLKTSSGIQTNAVYGFTKMLLKVIENEKPDFVAAAVDKGPPLERLKEYPEYKIHRHKQPEDLTAQLPLIEEVLKTLGIPVYWQEGYEADDCLASLAKLSEKKGLDVLILSGDLDLLQAVSSNIKVLVNKKGVSEVVYYDLPAVKKRYQLNPDQLVDLKALAGDSSDNIPGVPGIGEVSAIKLLLDFKNLDNLIKNMKNIPDKYRDKIIHGIEAANLSKRLAALKYDLDLKFNLDDLKFQIPDEERWLELVRRLEFKSLAGGGESSKSLKEIKINFIEDSGELKRYLFSEEKISLFFFNDGGEISLAFSLKKENFYLKSPEDHIADLSDLFKDKNILKIVYNVKDFYRLIKAEFDFLNAFDVMLSAYLLNPEELQPKITSIIAKNLNLYVPEYKDLMEDKAEPVKSRLQSLWTANIARSIYEVFFILSEKLKSCQLLKLYEEVEFPLARVLCRMEENGIKIDSLYLKELSVRFKERQEKIADEAFDIAGECFNLNSPKQVGQILFEKLNLPSVGRTKTGYKTDAQALSELSCQHVIAEKILKFRETSKLKSTYIDNLPHLVDKKTGKLHTTFHQTGTATGRLSSSDPNLQNIPVRTELGRLIRRAFIPEARENLLISCDYSQIELRILAHLSGDKNLIKAFKDNEDIHTQTAKKIFQADEDSVTSDMRRKAKEINFGIIYGMSEFGLAERLKIKKGAAGEYIQNYFSSYPGVKKYIEKTLEFALKNGFVCTILGRRRLLPDIGSRNFALKKAAERMAVNATIQGSSADIIKVAMLKLEKVLRGKYPSCKLLLQVHDELILEAPHETAGGVSELTKEIMSSAVELCIPLKVDTKIGSSWSEL